MVRTRTEDRHPSVAGVYRVGAGSPEADPAADPESDPVATVAIAAGFAQLAVDLYDAAGMAETVGRVLEFAVRLTGGDCAGVVLVHRGGYVSTAGVTDARVVQADRLQLEYGEGPCVPVSRVHDSVVVCDTVVDRRWPRWSPRVAEVGLRSVLTVWLFTTRSTLGALSLYATHPGQFTTANEATARLLAVHASVAVATVQQASTLAQALEARTLIGQAQGLLMERFAIDADRAFAVLRRYSQDNNLKLRAVAGQLLATGQLPPGRQQYRRRTPGEQPIGPMV